jgi:hypothetical protein
VKILGLRDTNGATSVMTRAYMEAAVARPAARWATRDGR